MIFLYTISNYPNYRVGDDGEFYSNCNIDNPYKKIKQHTHPTGYKYICLYNEDGRQTFRSHRVVAESIIPNPNNYPVVHHKDSNKGNNKSGNLQWVTQSENTKITHEENPYNKKGYEDNQSFHIKATRLSDDVIFKFGSASIAANELNISKSTICRQINNKTKCDHRSKFKFELDNEV